MRNLLNRGLLLALSIVCACSPVSFETENELRVIEFYDLRDPSNSSFFRRNQEPSTILLEATKEGSIPAYLINYRTGEVSDLAYDSLLNRITYEVDIWGGFGNDPFSFGFDDESEEGEIQYYFPSELSTVGLDITIGSNGEESYRSYNFFNLYVPRDVNPAGFDQYVVSYRFEDVQALFEAKGVIWYNYTFPGLWGQIITSFDGDYIYNTLLGNRLASLGYTDQLDASHKYSDTLDLGVFSPEKLKKPEKYAAISVDDNFQLADIHVNPSLGEVESYVATIDLSQLGLVTVDPSPVYSYTDAIIAGLMKPNVLNDQLVQDRMVVSKNGRLILGEGTDDLSSQGRLTRYHEPMNLSNRKFKSRYVEELYLKDSLNRPLLNGETSLVEILLQSHSKNLIQAYTNDSLNVKMTREKFLENILLPEEFDDYDAPFGAGFGFSDDAWGEGSEETDEELAAKKAEYLEKGYFYEEPVTYVSSQMYQLALAYDLTFDKGGDNKQYEFAGLCIILPADENPAGFDRWIGWFKADELKQLLESDERANVGMDGETFNYYDFFEQRKFRSYFQKGWHISLN